MAPRISEDMRKRLVVWSGEGRSSEEIADLAGCSVRSVFKILAYHHEYGITQNPFIESTHGRSRELDQLYYVTYRGQAKDLSQRAEFVSLSLRGQQHQYAAARWLSES